MGKSKKRILHKGTKEPFENITREEALSQVVHSFSTQGYTNDIKNLVLLFGFSCEELLENGAKYEDVMSLEPFLRQL